MMQDLRPGTQDFMPPIPHEQLLSTTKGEPDGPAHGHQLARRVAMRTLRWLAPFADLGVGPLTHEQAYRPQSRGVAAVLLRVRDAGAASTIRTSDSLQAYTNAGHRGRHFRAILASRDFQASRALADCNPQAGVLSWTGADHS